MGHDLPPPDLKLALCPNSLAPTLGLQRQAYWDEVNPLLQQWRNVNNARCPECDRLIRVNMSIHVRLMHTIHVCFWRCPIPDCPLWFTSELNAKDHIERTHRFRSASANLVWSGSVAGHSYGLGLSAPLWTGVAQHLYHYREPGFRRSDGYSRQQ